MFARRCAYAVLLRPAPMRSSSVLDLQPTVCCCQSLYTMRPASNPSASVVTLPRCYRPIGRSISGGRASESLGTSDVGDGCGKGWPRVFLLSTRLRSRCKVFGEKSGGHAATPMKHYAHGGSSLRCSIALAGGGEGSRVDCSVPVFAAQRASATARDGQHMTQVMLRLALGPWSLAPNTIPL